MSDPTLMEKAVAELLTKALAAAEAAKDFAVEQLPDVAQQYVLYVGITATFWCVFALLIFLSPTVLFFVLKRFQDGEIDGDVIGPTVIFGIITTAISFGVFVISFDKAIMAFFAPKILLIQFAAELVK